MANIVTIINKTGRRNFITLSGNRCGSTWLQFMFNCLPDVSADFEAQLVNEVPTSFHIALKSAQTNLYNIFDKLADDSKCQIAGTKLVVPPSHLLNFSDIEFLRNTIDKNTAIIQIGRKYLDSCLSKLRNAGHLQNDNGMSPPKHTQQWLRKDPPLSITEKISVDLEWLKNDLEIRLRHDELFLCLAEDLRKYTYVEYNDIKHKFSSLVAFIGSQASDIEISEILSAPPTKKLPNWNVEESILNFSEINKIGDIYERHRIELLKKKSMITE
jgi:hypothetical protein